MTDTAYILLRDAFADIDGTLTSSLASPGAGYRNVTGTRWRIQDNKLFGGSAVGETSWGNSKVVYTQDASSTAYTRTQGRTLWAIVRLEDRQAPLALSWATSTSATDPRTDGVGWVNQDGSLDIITPSATLHLDASIHDIRDMHYMIAVQLFDQGGAIFFSSIAADSTSSPGRTTPWSVPAYPSAAVAYVTWRGTTASLYPSISAQESPSAGEAINGHTFDDVRVVDVADWSAIDSLATFADRFTRADNPLTPGNNWTNVRGTWGISSNELYIAVQPGAQMANCSNDAGQTEGIYHWRVNIKGAVGHFAVTFRHVSAGNFIRFSNNGTSNTWVLQIYASGAFSSSIVSGPATWAINTSYDITIKVIGSQYFVIKDDVALTTNWHTDSTNTYLTGTGIGVGTFDAVGANVATYDNIAAYPLTVTLPDELQAARNLALFQQTARSVLGSDTFTAANGTSLIAHDPDTGSRWQLPLGGGATIESNALDFADGNNHQLAIQPISTALHQDQITVTVPNPVTRWVFAGICPAYIDSSNWFITRLAADIVTQPTEDEIEVVRRVAGVTTVVGKVQFGLYFTNQAHNPVVLLTQVVSDSRGSHVLLVSLDGHYVQSYYLPTALLLSAGAGAYRMTTDDEGSTFDAWTARSMVAAGVGGQTTFEAVAQSATASTSVTNAQTATG